MRRNIEYKDLDARDLRMLNEYGIQLRKTNNCFDSNNGYEAVKTSRKNWEILADKILNTHQLKGVIKAYQSLKINYPNWNTTLEEQFKINKIFKLECHHRDGIKQNNKIENLAPFLTEKQHKILDNQLWREAKKASSSSSFDQVNNIKECNDIHLDTKYMLKAWVKHMIIDENIHDPEFILKEFYTGVCGLNTRKTKKDDPNSVVEEYIHLNLKAIKKSSENLGVKFEKLLSSVIQHEYIHRVLAVEQDDLASAQWDNIYNKWILPHWVIDIKYIEENIDQLLEGLKRFLNESS